MMPIFVKNDDVRSGKEAKPGSSRVVMCGTGVNGLKRGLECSSTFEKVMKVYTYCPLLKNY